MRIGIVRLSSLGDIIVSATFLPFLRSSLGSCEIDWIVDSSFEGILQESQMLDTLHSFPLKQNLKSHRFCYLKTLYSQLSSLKPYDMLLDMQGLIKSALIGKIIPKKDFLGFGFLSAKESLSALAYNKTIKIPYQSHILQRNAKLITFALELCGQNLQNPQFQKAPESKEFLDEMLHQRHKAFVVRDEYRLDVLHKTKPNVLFIIESSLPSKTYSASNFIALGKKMLQDDVRIFILFHNDKAKAQSIYEGLDGEAVILPKMNLLEVRGIMQGIDMAIGGDTGITHLAWALQRPSITLYGNTPPQRFALTSPINHYLSGNENPSYDKNDFSINHITPQSVYELFLAIKSNPKGYFSHSLA